MKIGRDRLLSALLLSALPLGCGGIETPEIDAPRNTSGSGGAASATANAGRGGRPAVLSRDAGVGGSSGTAGSGPDARRDAGASPAPPRMYCDAVAAVFQFKCGPSCHQNRGFASGDFAIGFEEARAHVDRVSARGANCGLLIDSRDPQNSLILTKITGDYPGPNCGAQMPTGPFEITDDEIDCISDWLEQFAR